jgi:hypothetical protein
MIDPEALTGAGRLAGNDGSWPVINSSMKPPPSVPGSTPCAPAGARPGGPP